MSKCALIQLEESDMSICALIQLEESDMSICALIQLEDFLSIFFFFANCALINNENSTFSELGMCVVSVLHQL